MDTICYIRICYIYQQIKTNCSKSVKFVQFVLIRCREIDSLDLKTMMVVPFVLILKCQSRIYFQTRYNT